MAGKLWIGTSGWHYDHWRGEFYPDNLAADRMLAFYCRSFRTVEINNSFYRLPARETFDDWRTQTPPGFLFAVKASRFITHMKKLKDPAPALALLFSRASALRGKLGPVLFQLPPGWRLNLERLRAFLAALPRGHDYVFEFRNETWFSDEVFELLDRSGVGFCIYQIAGRVSPIRVTGRLAYVRLHGPTEKAYQGSYPDEDLRRWARAATAWTRAGKDVYVYFDNDQAGFAAADAARLARLCEVPLPDGKQGARKEAGNGRKREEKAAYDGKSAEKAGYRRRK